MSGMQSLAGGRTSLGLALGVHSLLLLLAGSSFESS